MRPKLSKSASLAVNGEHRPRPRSVCLRTALLSRCSLIVIPMLSFTVLLIVMIYVYLWSRHHPHIENLDLDDGFYSNVFYVDLSATRLVLAASLSSSTVMALTGSFMALVSYIVAADLLWTSSRGLTAMLPSPGSLALLVDLLDGKRYALWIWIEGLWTDRHHGRASVWTVEMAILVQAFTLFLSLAIIATDTWLHVVTESIDVPYYKTQDPAELGRAYSYSRQLTQICIEDGNSPLPCSLRMDDADSPPVVVYDSKIKELWSSAPDAEHRIMDALNSSGAYIGPSSVDSEPVVNSQKLPLAPRFSARSYAANTACFITSDCGLEVGATGFTFNCSDGFQSQGVRTPFMIGPWYNASADFASVYENNKGSQSLRWGVFANLSSTHIEQNIDPNGPPDVQNIGTLDKTNAAASYAGVVVSCSLTLSTVDYGWYNESATGESNTIDGDENLYNIVLGPLITGFLNDNQLASSTLGALASTTQGKVSESTVVGSFQTFVSYLGLSLLGGCIETAPANSLELQDSQVITRVPKAPVIILMILNTWYALLGLSLYLLACFVIRRCKNPDDVFEVQALVTVKGLAEGAVSGPRGRSTEGLRVGVVKSGDDEDGPPKWRYQVWESFTGDKDDDEAADSLLKPSMAKVDSTTEEGSAGTRQSRESDARCSNDERR